MPRILLVDANPDHVRAIVGLVRYRTTSSVTVAADCASALRAARSDRPDVVMINAMLFCSADYGFRRAMAERPETASVPLVVHLSGRLEPLTARRIAAGGADGTVQLPVNAEELVAEVEKAIRKRAAAPPGKGVRRVAWRRVAAPTRGGGSEPAPPRAGAFRPVNWAVDGKPSPAGGPSRSPAQGAATRKPAPPARPSAEPAGRVPGGFRSLSTSARLADDAAPATFRPTTTDAYPRVKPSEVKN